MPGILAPGCALFAERYAVIGFFAQLSWAINARGKTRNAAIRSGRNKKCGVLAKIRGAVRR
jgi:hypothetical protein